MAQPTGNYDSYRRGAYDYLRKEYGTLGTYDDFVKRIDDEKQRQNLWKSAKKRHPNMVDYETWSSRLGYGVQTQEQQAGNQQAVTSANQQAQTQATTPSAPNAAVITAVTDEQTQAAAGMPAGEAAGTVAGENAAPEAQRTGQAELPKSGAKEVVNPKKSTWQDAPRIGASGYNPKQGGRTPRDEAEYNTLHMNWAIEDAGNWNTETAVAEEQRAQEEHEAALAGDPVARSMRERQAAVDAQRKSAGNGGEPAGEAAGTVADGPVTARSIIDTIVTEQNADFEQRYNALETESQEIEQKKSEIEANFTRKHPKGEVLDTQEKVDAYNRDLALANKQIEQVYGDFNKKVEALDSDIKSSEDAAMNDARLKAINPLSANYSNNGGWSYEQELALARLQKDATDEAKELKEPGKKTDEFNAMLQEVTGFDNLEDAQKAWKDYNGKVFGEEIMPQAKGMLTTLETAKKNTGEKLNMPNYPMTPGATFGYIASQKMNSEWGKYSIAEDIVKGTIQHIENYYTVSAQRDALQNSEWKRTRNFAQGLANTGRGAWQGITSLDNWDFGISDLEKNTMLLTAAQKYQAIEKAEKEGGEAEPLTPAEEALLEAAAMQMAVQATLDTGMGFTAGEVTAYAVPFMLQMVLSPTAAAGNSLGATVARKAMKKLFGNTVAKTAAGKIGRMAVKRLVKGAVQIGSNEVRGLAMAAGPMQAAATASAILERRIDSIEGEIGDDGQWHLSGVNMNDDESALQSIGRGFFGQGEENASEFSGDTVLEPAGDMLKAVLMLGVRGTKFGNVLNKMAGRYSTSTVGRFFNKLNRSQYVSTIRDFRKAAHMSGVFGETNEELWGGAIKALFDVEGRISSGYNENGQEETGVFSWDNYKETFITMLPMQVMFGMIGMGGYGINRHEVESKYNQSLNYLTAAFGPNYLSWRNSIDEMPEEKFGKMLGELIDTQGLTEDQKNALVRYGMAVQYKRGVSAAMAQDREHDLNEKVFGGAYDRGYAMEDAQEKQDAAAIAQLDIQDGMAVIARSQNRDAYMQLMRNKQYGDLMELMAADGVNDADRHAVEMCITSMQTTNGIEAKIDEKYDSMAADERRKVADIADKQNGVVTSVVLPGGKTGYVTSGTMTDGRYGGTLTVRKDEDGSIVMVDASSMLAINNSRSIEDVEAERIAPIDEARRNEIDDLWGTVPPMAVGNTVTMPNGESATVLSVDKNGNAQVATTSGATTTLPASYAQNLSDVRRMASAGVQNELARRSEEAMIYGYTGREYYQQPEDMATPMADARAENEALGEQIAAENEAQGLEPWRNGVHGASDVAGENPVTPEQRTGQAQGAGQQAGGAEQAGQNAGGQQQMGGYMELSEPMKVLLAGGVVPYQNGAGEARWMQLGDGARSDGNSMYLVEIYTDSELGEIESQTPMTIPQIEAMLGAKPAGEAASTGAEPAGETAGTGAETPEQKAERERAEKEAEEREKAEKEAKEREEAERKEREEREKAEREEAEQKAKQQAEIDKAEGDAYMETLAQYADKPLSVLKLIKKGVDALMQSATDPVYKARLRGQQRAFELLIVDSEEEQQETTPEKPAETPQETETTGEKPKEGEQEGGAAESEEEKKPKEEEKPAEAPESEKPADTADGEKPAGEAAGTGAAESKEHNGEQQQGAEDAAAEEDDVPVWTKDKAADARARGWRKLEDGTKVYRHERTEGVNGKETSVLFSDKEQPKGRYKVISVNDLSPSHLNKQKNVNFFIDEAQPKDRRDSNSAGTATVHAQNLNPEAITIGVTARDGAPVVNARGEVIQGNGRSDTLHQIYEGDGAVGETYKQYLKDNAATFGLKPEDIDGIENPVLVRELDVDDDEAIRLGQFGDNDITSGGEQRMQPMQVIRKLGKSFGKFVEELFKDVEDGATLNAIIEKNGKSALKVLSELGAITDAQYASALKNGAVSATAKEDIRKIFDEVILEGGAEAVRDAFDALPSKTQNALSQTVWKDSLMPEEYKIRHIVQEAILAWQEANAQGAFDAPKKSGVSREDAIRQSFDAWARNATLESAAPNERFSKFALELAFRFHTMGQVGLRDLLNTYYKAANNEIKQAEPDTLSFEDAVDPKTREQLINIILNLDDNEDKGTDTGGAAGQQQKPAKPEGGAAKPEGGVTQEELAANAGGAVTTKTEEKPAGEATGTGETGGNAPGTEAEPAGNTAGTVAEKERDYTGKEPLTEDEIDAIPEDKLSATQKAQAKEWANGKRGNAMNAIAYLKAIGYVRNQQRNGEPDSSNADGTQPVAPANNGNGGRGTNGTGRGEGEQLDKPESEQPEGGKGGKNNVRPAAGEGGDSGVAPQAGGNNPAGGGRRGRGRNAGNAGSNVRGTRGEAGGTETVGGNAEAGEAVGEDQRGSAGNGGETRRRNAGNGGNGVSAGEPLNTGAGGEHIAAGKEKFNAALEKFKKNRSGKGGKLKLDVLNLVSLGLINTDQLEALMDMSQAIAEMAYGYLQEGISKFNDFVNKTVEDGLYDALEEEVGFTKEQIDSFMEDVWNSQFVMNGESKTIAQWAAEMDQYRLRKAIGRSMAEKRDAQRAAEKVETKVHDLDNIRESLPFLLPQQQEDVYKAEMQFFHPTHQDRDHANGKGFLFTNGTGTGKTYTGLGIAKRFIKQGKGRVLIVTPTAEKVLDWKEDAKNLGIDLRDLEEPDEVDVTPEGKKRTATTRKGKGAIVTTFANFRANQALLEDDFDLIIYDESHKLMESKNATKTETTRKHFLMTNKDYDTAMERLQSVHPAFMAVKALEEEKKELNKQWFDELIPAARNAGINMWGWNNPRTTPEKRLEWIEEQLNDRLTPREQKHVLKEMKRVAERTIAVEPELSMAQSEAAKVLPELTERANKAVGNTKVVFLSATPFNTKDNLDYAEGYIFSYPEEDEETKGSKNHRSARDEFYEQHFGSAVKWRYGKLQKNSDASEDVVTRQEMDFADWLMNDLGTMSTRMIENGWDYSRDFPVMNVVEAAQFNAALEDLQRDKDLQPLAACSPFWDYQAMSVLFETMKVAAVLPRIKEHIAMGRKVVIFHRRVNDRKNLARPPFADMLQVARDKIAALGTAGAASNPRAKAEVEALRRAIPIFEQKYGSLLRWEQTLDYRMPRQQLAMAFGDTHDYTPDEMARLNSVLVDAESVLNGKEDKARAAKFGEALANVTFGEQEAVDMLEDYRPVLEPQRDDETENEFAKRKKEYDKALKAFKANRDAAKKAIAARVAERIAAGELEKPKLDKHGRIAKKVGYFAGQDSKENKHADVETFNDDDSEMNVIVVQEASGKEGISLHDKTGKHQRVMMQLALPQSPIAFIQIEGRVFRIGQASNAIFEYPLLGIDQERRIFAQNMNSAAATTENLAMGSQARALKRSIMRGVLEHTGNVPVGGQGVGGKEFDQREDSKETGFDQAIKDYYGTRKMESGRENHENDYYPTPEPLGWKMVEWLGLTEGEEVLEPSAGHGAIARYIPDGNKMLAVELGMKQYSELALITGAAERGTDGARGKNHLIMQGDFMTLDTGANKADCIVMNPPYGVGGKEAMEHLEKAWKHLNNGGRLIAVLPDGPAMQKRLDAWISGYSKMTEDEYWGELLDGGNPDPDKKLAKADGAHIVAELHLPSVTFKRAGTGVRTKVVVIDKQTRPEVAAQVDAQGKMERTIDEVKTVEELFEELRDLQMPKRVADPLIRAEKAARTFINEVKTNELFEASGRGNDKSANIGMSYSGEQLYFISSMDNGCRFWTFMGMGLRRGPKGWNYDNPTTEWLSHPDNTLAKGYMKAKELLACKTTEEMESVSASLPGMRDGYYVEKDKLRDAKEMLSAWMKMVRNASGLTDNQLERLANGEDVYQNVVLTQGNLSMQTLRAMFDDSNKKPELRRLFDRVYGVAEQLGIRLRFEKGNSSTPAWYAGNGVLAINPIAWKRADISYEKKGQIVLHELIHSVTQYALNRYEAGIPLPENLERACEEVMNLFEQVKKGSPALGSTSLGQNDRYGLTNAHEMLAELANPAFRSALKFTPIWKKLVNAIKKFFGFFEKSKSIAAAEGLEQSDLLTEVEDALEKMLDAFDEKTWKDYTAAQQRIAERNGNGVMVNEIVVTDQAIIDKLEKSPKIRGYRNVVLHEDGTFGSPMASGLRSKGTGTAKTTGFELGKWEQAEEHPEVAVEVTSKKGEKQYKVNLVKPDGKSVDSVDYNPYIHNRPNKVNKQFKQAWERPDLVYIETEIATEADLDEGYHADKAAKSVGVHNWPTPSSSQKLILSRYDKPVRIVPWEEVADDWEKEFKESGVNFDIIPPALLPILAARGVEILPPHKGMGKECEEAYKKFKNEGNKSEGSAFDKVRWARRNNTGSMITSWGNIPSSLRMNASLLSSEIYTYHSDVIFRELDNIGDGETFKWFSMHNGVWYFYSVDKDGNIEIVHAIRAEETEFEEFKKVSNEWTNANSETIRNDLQQTELSGRADNYQLVHFLTGRLDESNGLDMQGVDKDGKNDQQKGDVGKTSRNGIKQRQRRVNGQFAAGSSETEALRSVTLETAEKLGGHVRVITSLDGVKDPNVRRMLETGRGVAYYNVETGDVIVYAPNLVDADDAKRTVLHELAGHRGLRTLFGNREFDRKMHEIFRMLPADAKMAIVQKAVELRSERMARRRSDDAQRRSAGNWGEGQRGSAGNGGGYEAYLAEATEEFLAECAERMDPADIKWWQKAMAVIRQFLREMGLEVKMHDDDIAYLIWKGANAMKRGENPWDKPLRDWKMMRKYGTGIFDPNRNHDDDGPGGGGTRRRSAGNWGGDGGQGSQAAMNGTSDGIRWRDRGIGAESSVAGMRYNTEVGTYKPDGWRNAMRSGEVFRRSMQGLMARIDEGWHDMLRSLNQLQKSVLAEAGGTLTDWENAYLRAQHLSSVNQPEIAIMHRRLVEPLFDFAAQLYRRYNTDKREMEKYLVAVHGTERNEQFARRDAERAMEGSAEKEALDNAEAEKRRIEASGGMPGDPDYDRADRDVMYAKAVYDAKVQAKYDEYRKIDYSGLTETFREPGDPDKGADLTELEERAARYASDYETKIGPDNAEVLWKRVKALSDFALKKAYESGMMSRKTYDKVRTQFEHYVPLRGWDEDTAEDVYEYVAEGDGQREAVQAVLRNAAGRKSTAGDIIETLGAMAHSAILTGNKNMAKMALLRLAENHPTKLMTVTKMWYVNTPTGWQVAALPEDASDAEFAGEAYYGKTYEEMTVEERANFINKWEESMRRMRASGDARESGQGLRLKQPIIESHMRQHQVRVKRNGKEYVVNINGAPNAAQAINGQLNMESNLGPRERVIAKGNRWIARAYTSWNPEFMVRNFCRDLISATTISGAKYGSKYAGKLLANIGRLVPLVSIASGKYRSGDLMGKAIGIGGLYRKWQANELDESVEMERLFKEFIENGGETGYSQLWKVDDYVEKMKKAVKAANEGPAKRRGKAAMKAVGQSVEFLNKMAENTTRFAVFMTSRQMGKSVLQSVADAKEASTNFNKKGSGAYGNRTARNMFIFMNASIQGMMRYYDLLAGREKLQNERDVKQHLRTRGIIAMGSFIALGMIMTYTNVMLSAMASGGDGDDDDKGMDNPYWRISDFKRWNNLTVGPMAGEYGALSINLGVEEGALYGLGAIMMEHAMGHGHSDEMIGQLISQITRISPFGSIDPVAFKYMDNEAKVSDILSHIVGSYADIWLNAFFTDRDFMGKQITRRSDYNEKMPEFRRTRYDTPKWQVELSKWAYDEMGINYNPNVADYLMSNNFGGIYQFPSKVISFLYSTIVEGESVPAQDAPFISTFWQSTNQDWRKDRQMNEEFKYFKYDIDRLGRIEAESNRADRTKAEKKRMEERIKEDDKYKYYKMWKSKYEKDYNSAIKKKDYGEVEKIKRKFVKAALRKEDEED